MIERRYLRFKLNFVLILLIPVTAILCYAFFKLLGQDSLHLVAVDLTTLVFLSLISLPAYALTTYTCHYILLILGHKCSLKKLYLILTLSLGANLATPIKIGVPLRAVLYQRLLNVPYSTGIAALTIEVFLCDFVGLIISFFGLLFIFRDTALSVSVFSAPLLVSFLLLFLFTKPRYYGKVINRIWFLKKRRERIIALISNTQSSLKKLKKFQLTSISLLFFMGYLINAIRIYFVLFALGFSLDISILLYIQAISFTLGSLSMLPMGLGIRDVSIISLLSYIGLPMNVAIPVALIERLLTSGISIILALVSALLLGVRKLRG